MSPATTSGAPAPPRPGIPTSPVRIRMDKDTKQFLGRIGQTILSVLAAWLTERIIHWAEGGNPGTVTTPTKDLPQEP